MLPHLQEDFAKHLFTPEKYDNFLKKLYHDVGMTIEYRVAEFPVFCSQSFKEKVEQAAVEIMEQSVRPEYLAHSDAAMQARYTVPYQNDKPLFCITDFAVTQNDQGEFEPKLIELQGFPSLYGYQYILAHTYKEAYSLSAEYGITFNNLSDSEYISLIKKAILGDHDPETVALLEFDPPSQKTRTDFLSLQKLIGIEETDIRTVRKEGNKLFHQRNGRWVPIERIFNRAIIDELDEQNVVIPFNWNDDLKVEWAGHPNWYFRISKYTLPFLKHSAVPRSTFLNELTDIPSDTSKYVLKPLFAFAGKGVNVSPTAEDIAAVPESERATWMLMEKVEYAECLYTPEGMNKLELRVMMIWLPEWKRPKPVMSLVRTGRGGMMGVRFNNVPWTGSSGCLFV